MFLKGYAMFASLHTSTLAVARVQTSRPLGDLVARLRSAVTLRTQRQHLLSLDDARLCDIGLTREQAMAEAARPLWDVPHGWRV